MSLLLAFAMIFTAVVPALAAQPRGKDTADELKDHFVFKLDTTKNGLQSDDKLVTLYKGKAGAEEFKKVADNTKKDGFKDYIAIPKKDVKAGETYFLVFGQLKHVNVEAKENEKENATLVEIGSNWYYKFVVEKDGVLPAKGTDSNDKPVEVAKMVADGTPFAWKEFIKDEEFDFTVIGQDKDKKMLPNLEFQFVELKNDGTKFITDKGNYVKSDKVLTIDKATTFSTTKTGVRGFSEADLDILRGQITDILGKDIVGITVNGVLVAVADITKATMTKGTQVIIHKVPKVTELRVTVVGLDRKVDKKGNEAPKAIEGAVVELQPNETKIFEAPKFGKAIDTQTTNAKGVAVFKNPSVSTILNVLYPQRITENKEGKVITEFVEQYTNMSLANQLVVTKADGFGVPKTASLAEIEEKDGVMEITIELLPVNVSYNHRIKGANRYATSVEVAKEAFPEYKGANGLILASGDVYADALVANGLVGLKNAPLVLNSVSKLDPTVKAYIKDLKAKDLEKVTIVGGNGSVSGSVQKELEELGLTTERIAGTNRYETSVKVLQHFYKASDKEALTDVFLTSGENFADALVASVPSALYARPILLTAKDNLPKVVKDAIENKDYGINKVTVVGGTGSVSDKVYGSITISNIERLKGDNRQLTAMAVANEYFMNAGEAIITNGQVYADALSAGQLAWKKNAPILLSNDANTISEALAKYLQDAKMTEITLVGGTSTLTEKLDKQVYEAISK